MKNKILLSVIVLLIGVTSFAQVTNKIQADSVKIYQLGNHTAELIIENSTKANTNGFLQNWGNGRTRFAYALDSVWLNSGSLYFRRGSTTTSFPVRSGIDSITIRSDSIFQYVDGIAYFKGMISPGSVAGKLNISDTSSMLAPYLKKIDTTGKWLKSFNATVAGSAFGVSGVPITPPGGTIAFSWLGSSSQYVKGNGGLGTFSTDVQTIGDARYAFSTHSHTSSDITDITTYVRNLFTAGTGLSYNSTTGTFAWTGSASGITSFNGLTGTTQTLALDTTTSSASWSSVGTAHTLRLPARIFLFDSTKFHSEDYFNTKYQPTGSYVPTSRTITINGTTLDLSANRSWTIASGGTWGSITGTLNSQTDLRDSLRNRYVGMRQISDTSFALRKWNGTGFIEDTVVIQWADGTFGDVTTTGHRSNFTINSGAVTDSKLSTGINANKIADGSVSNTEFQYLNSVTSNVQTQLDGKQATLVSGTNIKTINGNSLLGSGNITITSSGGSTNDFRELKGKIGVTSNAPNAGDSIIVWPGSSTRKINFFREGELQFDSTSSGYGYERSGDTIKAHPAFAANERVILQSYPDSNWTNVGWPGYDADAQAYFDAVASNGGTLSTLQKSALNNFFLNAKSHGYFTGYFDKLHLTIESTGVGEINLVDPTGTKASFVGGTWSSTGFTGNGTSDYINSHWVGGSSPLATSNNYHISAYEGTSTGMAGMLWGVVQVANGADIWLNARYTDNLLYAAQLNRSQNTASNTDGKGLFLQMNTGSGTNTKKVYKNTTLLLDGDDNGNGNTLPSNWELTFLCYNQNNTKNTFRAARVVLYSTGKAFTPTIAGYYQADVNQLVTELGAQ